MTDDRRYEYRSFRCNGCRHGWKLDGDLRNASIYPSVNYHAVNCGSTVAMTEHWSMLDCGMRKEYVYDRRTLDVTHGQIA